MENRIVSLVIDAADAESLAQFWAGALGWQVVKRGNYGVSIGIGGGPFEIDFRFVPDGPKHAKNRIAFRSGLQGILAAWLTTPHGTGPSTMH